MIRRATAVRYNDKPKRGRTQPVYATVATDDDAEHDVVLKFTNGETTVEHLANEILGCMLAADVGVPVMTPYLVTMEPDFIGSIGDASVRARMTPGLAFGSTYAATQWQLWESFNKVAAAQTETAASIFAFDAFTANNDRSPGNPNLLVKGDEWRAIDHDAAFMFRMKLFPARPEPWRVGNLELMRNPGADSEHVFASHLRGKVEGKLAHIGAAWRDLTDARFAQYDAMLPNEWDSVRGRFGEAISHLKRVRDNIDACLTELERVLS